MNLAKWSIGIFSGTSPITLGAVPGLANPIIRAEDVTDVPARFVADPFWVKDNSTWHMFFEVWNGETRRGEIGLASSPDALNWTYDKIIVRENFHLSYPYVFKRNDRYFMIPETRQSQSVRLYEASDFPRSFTFHSTLLHGNFADPSIVFFDNMWWLFVLEGTESLELYYSNELEGPWIKHPNSPLICNDKQRARPGGRIIDYNGALIRFAQNCVPVYGHQLRAFRIDVLTTDDYQESECTPTPVLSPQNELWCNHAMHHADPMEISPGVWIACVDGATLVPATESDIPAPPG